MPLTSTDWAVIIGYLLVNLAIGIYYRRRASGNTEEFFVSGRDVSWWLAGTSMVATTFAADTPLLVCGLVGVVRRWHADGVLLCALLAPRGDSDRRAIL
jgi:solute:Na+ symporter, SSS family